MNGLIWRVIGLLAAVLCGSCAQAFANEYYEVGSSEAVYLAWTQDSAGHLQGQVEIVSMDSSNSTQLSTRNASFTGTRSGSDVSLTFASLFGGSTWTGHVGWNTLTLIIPTPSGAQRAVLRAGSFDQFESAVSRLRGNAAVNQTRVALLNAVNEAGSHLNSGSSSITQALASLRTMLQVTPANGSLRTKYVSEWQKMQDAWRKEQSDAQVTPMTCYQRSQVVYDASQVNYELSQVKYLDSEAQYIGGQYAYAVRQVSGGIAELQTWAPAFNQRTAALANSEGRTYNHDAVAAYRPLILNAQASLKTYAARWATVKSFYAGYDRRAQQLDDEARTFPNSITCSG